MDRRTQIATGLYLELSKLKTKKEKQAFVNNLMDKDRKGFEALKFLKDNKEEYADYYRGKLKEAAASGDPLGRQLYISTLSDGERAFLKNYTKERKAKTAKKPIPQVIAKEDAAKYIQEQSPHIGNLQRSAIKNLSNNLGDMEEAVRLQYPDLEVERKNGQVWVKRKEDLNWKALDPNNMGFKGYLSNPGEFVKDAFDIGTDMYQGGLEASGMTSGYVLGRGGVTGTALGSMAAGGIGGAGNLARQGLSKALGYKKSDIDYNSAATDTALSGLMAMLPGGKKVSKKALDKFAKQYKTLEITDEAGKTALRKVYRGAEQAKKDMYPVQDFAKNKLDDFRSWGSGIEKYGIELGHKFPDSIKRMGNSLKAGVDPVLGTINGVRKNLSTKSSEMIKNIGEKRAGYIENMGDITVADLNKKVQDSIDVVHDFEYKRRNSTTLDPRDAPPDILDVLRSEGMIAKDAKPKKPFGIQENILIEQPKPANFVGSMPPEKSVYIIKRPVKPNTPVAEKIAKEGLDTPTNYKEGEFALKRDTSTDISTKNYLPESKDRLEVLEKALNDLVSHNGRMKSTEAEALHSKWKNIVGDIKRNKKMKSTKKRDTNYLYNTLLKDLENKIFEVEPNPGMFRKYNESYKLANDQRRELSKRGLISGSPMDELEEQVTKNFTAEDLKNAKTNAALNDIINNAELKQFNSLRKNKYTKEDIAARKALVSDDPAVVTAIDALEKSYQEIGTDPELAFKSSLEDAEKIKAGKYWLDTRAESSYRPFANKNRKGAFARVASGTTAALAASLTGLPILSIPAYIAATSQFSPTGILRSMRMQNAARQFKDSKWYKVPAATRPLRTSSKNLSERK